jgi:uncharacterized BrkB/YihY/UPF0761 family membrane protein
MHFGTGWYLFSCVAFACATMALLASGFVFLSMLGKLAPLLQDTHNEILDLGDIAANTVGHASDTLDLVEQRVSETMGQAELGAKSARTQVVGVGSALAGLYLASRFIGMLRSAVKPKHRRKHARRKLF